MNALFALLAELTGYDQPPEFGPVRVGDIRHSVLDPTLAGSVLGWHATTSLRSGLTTTLESWTSDIGVLAPGHLAP